MLLVQFIISGQHAQITEQYHRHIQEIASTWIVLALVLLPVLVMVASIHTVLLTFRKVKGLSFHCHVPNHALSKILRHMNIDYAVCQALSQIKDINKAILIYDIGCQWFTNFQSRTRKSTFLPLRDTLELIPAVGKFHLGAHVKECFTHFSLNFIHGAAQLDGEILETLWSSLDHVAGSTRAMSKAHRQEVLDDYINDSNWKKMIKSGQPC
jgi:hypothetical protein